MIRIELFCLIAAITIVVAKLLLERQEEKDRASGKEVDPKDYRFWNTVKNVLKAPFQTKKDKKKKEEAK